MFANKYRILPRILRVAVTNHAIINKRNHLISLATSHYLHNSRTYHSDQRPRADFDHKTEVVNLFIRQHGKEDNEVPLQYPWLWLRDNCQCSTCFHPVAQNRTFNMDQLDVTVKPINVQVKNDNLCINWSDDHESLFSLDWLRERAFTPPAREAAKRRFYPKLILWGSDQLQDKIPSFDFTQVLESDKVTYQWLDSLAKYGLVLLKNAPTKVGQVEKLARKISFHRRTHYGDIMPVKVSENPYSLAYTSNHPALHTDTGWSLHPVGVHTLHCIVQAKSIGGENEFVDTFNVASQMKQERPEEYELLCQTPLYHMDRGKDKFGTFYKQAVHPLFRFNVYGEIDQIIFSNISRDSFLNLPVEKVAPFLKALRLFFDTCYDSKNIVRVKLDEGDIVMFVNTRVLHGRTAYKVEESGQRHLETVYLDMEEVLSRRFLLHSLLDKD